jgi:hypothetical protein
MHTCLPIVRAPRRQPSDVLEIARLEERVESLEKELLWWRTRCGMYREALEKILATTRRYQHVSVERISDINEIASAALSGEATP